MLRKQYSNRINFFDKVIKSTRWMPWLQEAMKDVDSCDKLGRDAYSF